MSSASNPFDDLMKIGQDWAKSMGQNADVFSPEAMAKMWPTMPKDAMEAFMGKGSNPDGLDAKTRLLLTIQGLVIQGAQAAAPLELTIRHAFEAEATAQEITEAIALAGLFGGAAGIGPAMEILAETQAGQGDDK